MSDNFKFVQAQPFTLAGSGCTIGATTITLASFAQIDGTLLTMTDFGTKGFLTAEPGNGTREEQLSFTGVVQNANGTATLTGVSNVLFVDPYTETSGTGKSHPGGSTIIITNTSGFYGQLTSKSDDETITGTWTFTNPNYPRMDTDTPYPTDNAQLATKAYADSLTFAGAPNATTTQKGIVELATQAEVDAKTATGGTGASLVSTPALARSTLLNDYKADTGAANAYVITPAPAITAYAAGQIFSFKATNANTTTSTLNVNALGAKTIKKNGTLNLVANDILAGQIVVVEYDGTNLQMISEVGNNKISQIGTEIYAADSVGTDAYAITLVPALAAYVTGMVINFNAGTANTGAATLAVNGLAAKTIKKRGGTADLNDNDIRSGQVASVVYDGTNFQLQSLPGTSGNKIAFDTTGTTVASTNVETTIFTTTVTGGTLGTGNAIVTKLYMSALTGTSRTLTLKFKYGVTTLITQTVATNAQTLAGLIEFVLFANAATGAQLGELSILGIIKGDVVSGTSAHVFSSAATGSSSIDSTANQTLAVTATWDSSSSSSLVIDKVTAELIYA